MPAQPRPGVGAEVAEDLLAGGLRGRTGELLGELPLEGLGVPGEEENGPVSVWEGQ